MGSLEKKFEKQINNEEFSSVMQAISKLFPIEQTEGAENLSFEADRFTKLKLSIKPGDDGAFIKAKLKRKMKKDNGDSGDAPEATAEAKTSDKGGDSSDSEGND